MFKFTWNMRNVLKLMKKQFSDFFAIFSFWDMVIFVLKTSNFWWIFTITRKIKVGKLIFQSMQHIAHLSYPLPLSPPKQKWPDLLLSQKIRNILIFWNVYARKNFRFFSFNKIFISSFWDLRDSPTRSFDEKIKFSPI